MKFRCKRADLAQALSIAAGVAPARTSVPILQNVKLSAADGELLLTGTDLDMGLRYAVRDVGIQKSGSAVLPAQKLLGIVRDCRDDEVKFDVDGKLCTIEIEGGSFKLTGADPQDFPQFPEFVEGRAVRIAADDFRDMVRKTAFAAANEPSRYALTGVLFVIRENEARMVGTDGKRLAYAKKKIKGGPKDEIKVIIPPKGLHLIEKILGDEDEEVAFEFEETQVKAKTSAGIAFCRLVEGSFPNYEEVIPSDADKKILIAPSELEYRLRLVANMTDEKCKAVRFHLSKDRLTLFSRRISSEAGEASHVLPVKYQGPEFEIVFNPDFFVDYLKVVGASADAKAEPEPAPAEAKAKKGKGEKAEKAEKAPPPQAVDAPAVSLELRDKTTAGVIRAGRDYVYLVMPLTVDV